MFRLPSPAVALQPMTSIVLHIFLQVMRLVFGQNLHSSVMGSVLLAMLLLVKDLNPNFITHLASVPHC